MTREEAVYMLVTNYPDSCYGLLLREAVDMAIEALEEPEQKKGKWIDMGAFCCACNQCGHMVEYHTNFCAKCGAKMEGEENENKF